MTGLSALPEPLTAARLAILLVLILFLPLSALTYQLFRSHRKKAKIERFLDLLKVREYEQRKYLEIRTGPYLCISVSYATLVAALGLTILLFGDQMGFDQNGQDPQQFPVARSWLIFGMGFLGGYLWGIQYVFRRYADDDLTPGVYHALAIRMMLAGTLAVVVYNVYENLGGKTGEELTGQIWPALAFVLGMFPQRGISWVYERVPFFAQDDDPSVRKAPLEMIEGVTFHDRVRLEEASIDNCYDLATADFVPLVFDTPYSARELTDWILQAKLCVYAPEAMLNLRQQGIRTIMDLEGLDQKQIQELVEATAVTKSALERALRSLKTDEEIQRLRQIGRRLGIFTGLEDTLLPLPGNSPVPAFPGTGLNEPAATFRDLHGGTTDPDSDAPAEDERVAVAPRPHDGLDQVPKSGAGLGERTSEAPAESPRPETELGRPGARPAAIAAR
jgi:hypothetical protein